MIKQGTIKGDLLAQLYNHKQNYQMFSKATVFAAAIAATSNALCLWDAATDGQADGADCKQGKKEKWGQYVELQTLAYSIHAAMEKAWLCQEKKSGIADTALCAVIPNYEEVIFYGAYLSELVRRGGEPCANAGLVPVEGDDLADDPWQAYLASIKLSQKMKSMVDASISCYASPVVADTEWCKFWLYGGGQ